MKKLAVRLALASYTSIEFYMDLSIRDLFEIAEEIKAVNGNG